MDRWFAAMVGAALLLIPQAEGQAQPLPGQIVVDPDNPAWLARAGGGPFFMAGPGSPEGFLYQGTRAAGGTRDGGNQMRLIDRLGRTGANSLYLMAVRSHGGDGGPDENPFNNPADPTSGLNPSILDQWEQWFTAMDEAGIVIQFFFYDDSASPFGGSGRDISAEGAEANFIEALVNRFEQHKNLIWVIAEEYSEANSKANARRIAEIIRAADDHDHPVGVHQLDGRTFDFPDDPNIDQFVVQRNIAGAGSINREVVASFEIARGRYNLNMSESSEHYDPDHPDRTATRRYSWAAAMGGAYVMVYQMDAATTPEKILEDHGRMVRFFEQTPLSELSPHNELAVIATKHVLAKPGEKYILYSDVAENSLTIDDIPAGRYALYWFDPVDGDTARATKTVEGGRQRFAKPSAIGPEAALYVRRSDSGQARDAQSKTGTLWSPYLEWEVSNPSYSGNPFDLVARVTFEHDGSGETHETEMFYDGSDTWKWRFTGTRTGQWTFTTVSDDPDLDGRSGTVTIEPNPDDQVEGFLTHAGNRYALQTGAGGATRGYLLNVYMNGKAFPVRDSLAQWTEALTDAYLDEAQQNGFETIFVHVTNHWFKLGAQGHDEHSSEDPDRATFEVLENLIARAHRRGMRVHLWAWGDESRKWTPVGVGGINGGPDRRLQRYIAARLGPLPGWTMGYGFDLHEWVSPEQLDAWAEYLHAHFGWDHLLAARGFALGKRGSNNMNSYGGFGRETSELTTTQGGPQDYTEIAQDLKSDTTRPHFYAERHTYNRVQRRYTGADVYFYLNMEGTRRLLWWQAMAGGMGGFYGFYATRKGDERPPYDKPEMLRTHHTFWDAHERFRLDMKRANELSGHNTARVLKSASSDRYVLYREDAGDIQVDLSAMEGPQPAVAVDTRSEYKEVKVGPLNPAQQTIELPYRSDWAVAVGSFTEH